MFLLICFNYGVLNMKFLFPLFLSAILFLLSPISSSADDFDLIIRGADIYDGSGDARYQADIGIKGDRIATIGDLKGREAAREINASGLALSPGFIDLHSHAERKILDLPLIPNMVQQGITTILGGNCGGSPADTADFLTKVAVKDIGPNLALLIGHNTVREAAMGTVNRLATQEELAAMKTHIDGSMAAGAFGMSTGLKYVPGVYSNTDEVIELAKVSASHGGIYTSHMREEGVGLIPAIKELLNIGTKANVPVHISHHKAVGLVSWGDSVKSLALIDAARKTGQDVTLDQYPYTASSTGFSIIFPAWSLAGGNDELVKRLADPMQRKKIKDGIIHNIKTDRGGGDPARIQVAQFPPDTSLDGKTFKDILLERGDAITIDNAAELAIELQSQGGGQAIYHAMDEGDVSRIMQHKFTSIATDGANPVMGEGNPHPRNYGTYPRVLGKYVRQDGILSLSDAVRKMTALPAARMGLDDRGLVKEGYFADLVLFDPNSVLDKATFTAPHQHAVGISYVIINGAVAKAPDGLTGVGSGQILRHAQ